MTITREPANLVALSYSGLRYASPLNLEAKTGYRNSQVGIVLEIISQQHPSLSDRLWACSNLMLHPVAYVT